MKLAHLSILPLVLGFAACDVGGATSNGPVVNPNPVNPVGEGRVIDGLEALFTFQEGTGNLSYDTSNRIGGAYVLEVDDPNRVTWLPGGGVNLQGGVLLTQGPINSLGSACMNSNAVTLEAWVRTQSVIQDGPAHILSYSAGPNSLNFAITQAQDKVEVRLRTSDTDESGSPATRSEGTAFNSTVNPIHLAYRRNGAEDIGYVYVNGQYAGETSVAGNFSNWNMDYQLAIGADAGQGRPWNGDVFLVAVYCRDLSPTEIADNYRAGQP